MVKSKNNRMSNPSKKKLPLPACDARCRPTQRDDRIVFRQRDDDSFFAFVAVEPSLSLSTEREKKSAREIFPRRRKRTGEKHRKNYGKNWKEEEEEGDAREERRPRRGGEVEHRKRERRGRRDIARRVVFRRALPPLPREAFRARFGAETREKERERERERERESVCRLEQKNDKK